MQLMDRHAIVIDRADPAIDVARSRSTQESLATRAR